MDSTLKNNEKTLATLIHLSVFTKYFIPFGNFIFPLILWLTKKQDKFVDHHGRNAVNFQISLVLYLVILVCLGLAGIIFMGAQLSLNDPFFVHNDFIEFEKFTQALPFIILIASFGILLAGLFILEIVAVISASLKASNGETYKYPLSINFITAAKADNHQSNHQSKNEQFNNTQNQTL